MFAKIEYKWKVLAAVVFGVFMIILDTTVVNVAFRTLSQEFKGDLNDAQWIVSIYVLSLGITMPLAGFLADRFGIKRMYISGLALFVVGSFLCSEAPSLLWLIVARAVQGFGGGLAMPLGLPQIYRAFPPHEQGVALGYLGVALVVGPAVGPMLGGWLIDHGAWRWIFRINLPIGLFGVAVASWVLAEAPSDRRPQLDVLGLITEIIGFGAVLYAASLAAERGWTAPEVERWFAIGGVGLAVFAAIQLWVARDPLLDLRLFRHGVFVLASGIGYVTVLALFGAEFLMPVYLQALRGLTALETGVRLLPMAATAGVALPVAGRLYDRIGPRPLLVAGFSLLAYNTWQLADLKGDTSLTWIMALLAIRGLALGLTVQTTMVTALMVVPLSELPRASALVNSTRQVVQSIGVAVLATVLTSTLSPTVKAYQKAALSRPHTGTGTFALCDPPATMPAVARYAIGEACEQYVAGFARAYTLTFQLTLVALALSVVVPGWPGAWTGRRGAPPPPAH